MVRGQPQLMPGESNARALQEIAASRIKAAHQACQLSLPWDPGALINQLHDHTLCSRTIVLKNDMFTDKPTHNIYIVVYIYIYILIWSKYMVSGSRALPSPPPPWHPRPPNKFPPFTITQRA